MGGRLVAERSCNTTNFNPGVTDLYLGVRKNGYQDRKFEGEYRAFRVSNKALYLKPFTPQAVFAKDATTEILLDFSSNDAEKIADVSGKDRHGLLNDVKWAEMPKKKR